MNWSNVWVNCHALADISNTACDTREQSFTHLTRFIQEQVVKKFRWKAASPSYHPSWLRMASSYLDPIWHMIPWAHMSQLPKQHLDRFSRFARHIHVTHTQTDHTTCDLCRNTLQLCYMHAMPPKNAKISFVLLIFSGKLAMQLKWDEKISSFVRKLFLTTTTKEL